MSLIKPEIVIKEELSINKRGIKKHFLNSIIEIEGLFKITISENVFFEDRDFPLLELFLYLQNWYLINKNGAFSDFYFKSIESDQEPLIAFYRIEGGWRIDSIWAKYCVKETLSLADVMEFLGECGLKIKKQMYELYKMKL